jgi:hypothetical protein
MSSEGYTLSEICEGNIIMCMDDDTKLMITANGSYFQTWLPSKDGKWECTEAFGRENDLYNTSAAALIDEAAALMQSLLLPDVECS